ncbi:conserved Plasmodium protein, unknown function [Plasmodium knowlesi strain H]|uniref:Uncharacterized protein n=3 Tax=Plasmodium knowlesi TaxID=5850 RepID=A0A1A7VHI9_PLAKH|nr:conserved Plasmodium protein, unknown function [Plasmodium knowlesi strain H]OTN63837.1 Uncharacterized protein PKNOH_S140255800 [Plasmodium knowlesi]CAA9990973.1 conserved Plasmodium protein, unknown function [Plasmodium knowlesi strain H]SBO20782.1 conserved Plasmodium protein, unknown function [Plasmodium knowlesi strain H]SBO21226.1 conserved Plasmodium protein, unknown function [Plasmodium knowlesi strain H]VVS80447.1 conserved Plasmodium protein, unknown function [Plasmodium knowlesi 
MKGHRDTKHISFAVVKFVVSFLLINICAISVRKNVEKIRFIMHQNDDNDIPIGKVVPYFSEETNIFENYMVKKVSHEDNICINAIRNNKNLNAPMEKMLELENETQVIQVGNKRNIYGYTNNLLRDGNYQLSNIALTFKVPINQEICEFNSFNNYILHINYLKKVSFEEIKTKLEKGVFIFVTLPDGYDLNKSIASFMGDKYSISKGTLENDYIKIDITHVIQYSICQKENHSKANNSAEGNPSDNVDNYLIGKSVEFVLLTSHELSDIILFSPQMKDPQFLHNYKNMRNIVKLKKALKERHSQWEDWSPCYSVCSDDFSYSCRRNKCMEEDADFCDRYYNLKFRKCESAACQVLLKEKINEVPKEDVQEREKEDGKAEEVKDQKVEASVDVGVDAVSAIGTAAADVAANEAENKEVEVEMHAAADEDYLDALKFRRRKEKKVNFFMWIMNNKKMALGLVLFLLGAIIFGCIYCYVSSSLGFHKDEEYCVSKYRAQAVN